MLSRPPRLLIGRPGEAFGVAALILAAGAARRMGRTKVLLPFRGEPLVRRMAGEALASRVTHVAVVVGAGGPEIARALEGLQVEIVPHPGWEAGIGTSIAAGLRHLISGQPELEAVVILLADQPLISASSIDRLLEARDESRRPIAASRHGSELGAPAVFGASFFPRLLALSADHGAREILREASESAAQVEMPEARVDLDSRADYDALIAEEADGKE